MAERRFDLIVFDWDGTLMDSTATIVVAIQAACADLGLPVPTREQASHVIGLGLADALHAAVPALDPADYARMVERYRHHYFARDAELVLFDGASDMVAALNDAGYALAVATGKSRKGLDRAFEASGLGAQFHASRTADETFSKPHPAMLLELIEEFAVLPSRTLMIGDTTHDLLMAKNAGTASVAVSFGAHPREALAAEAPLALVDSIAELHQWLQLNA
ncbi:HAD-IIIA family hydrolase [Niveibacterium sp. 24ML]|uniref:HAD family hydrolase n=1 Tax=Niveibacterium sp. 24ML TaxID=2985512 RepID=UPI00226D8CD8|nr:HAD-IIIA family hydrolase [Niveibacterium sp. 24ML]MCX9158263.1 HAD-IIIA family hydrolase [Niveibacterium sp. 24ML]